MSQLANMKYIKSYSAGIDFRRQILKSTDFRFWPLKRVPANPFIVFNPLLADQINVIGTEMCLNIKILQWVVTN